MLINLWVKDKRGGEIHQVGTDVHDSINFIDGQVIYENMQSSASTLDDYEFVEPPDLDDYVSVMPEELYLNRELIHKDLMAKKKKKIKKKLTERQNDVALKRRLKEVYLDWSSQWER